MSDLIAGLLDGLRLTLPFATTLPATTRPHDGLWQAYNRTLLSLRLPLHHSRLGKPRPKDKVFDDAIQQGLAMLTAFSGISGVRQTIVSFRDDACEAISFQPRPFEANWTRRFAITPIRLNDPKLDPMTLDGRKPQVATADLLHLARLTALAHIKRHQLPVHGTATFEFHQNNWDQPSTRIIYRTRGQPHMPAQIDGLRHAAP